MEKLEKFKELGLSENALLAAKEEGDLKNLLRFSRRPSQFC
jgi:hypothetical protein